MFLAGTGKGQGGQESRRYDKRVFGFLSECSSTIGKQRTTGIAKKKYVYSTTLLEPTSVRVYRFGLGVGKS